MRSLTSSRIADMALVVGRGLSLLGSAGAVVASVINLVRGEWFSGLVLGPLAFFFMLALVVVFERVADLKPPPGNCSAGPGLAGGELGGGGGGGQAV